MNSHYIEIRCKKTNERKDVNPKVTKSHKYLTFS